MPPAEHSILTFAALHNLIQQLRNRCRMGRLVHPRRSATRDNRAGVGGWLLELFV